MKILVINMLRDKHCDVDAALGRIMDEPSVVTVVNGAEKRIAGCVGCNDCWLKTPGVCRIKDDYTELFEQILQADKVWILTDIRLGFVSYETKNLFDRILPSLTMNLHFVNGQMRHVPRYDKLPDFGLMYLGDADRDYMNRWMDRVTLNLNVKSMGAYHLKEIV